MLINQINEQIGSVMNITKKEEENLCVSIVRFKCPLNTDHFQKQTNKNYMGKNWKKEKQTQNEKFWVNRIM